MDPKNYVKQAGRTECDQVRAKARLYGVPPEQLDSHLELATPLSTVPITLMHSILGMLNELGELSSVLQKWLWYGKAYSQEELRTKFRDEMGDLLWHFSQSLRALGLDPEEVMVANIAKLRERYPDKWTTERATERDASNYAAEARAQEVATTNRPISAGSVRGPEQKIRGRRAVDHAWAPLGPDTYRCETCGALARKAEHGSARSYRAWIQPIPPARANCPGPEETPVSGTYQNGEESTPPRTVAEVMKARGSVVGCCSRHADNQACDCLTEATAYEEAVALAFTHASCGQVDGPPCIYPARGDRRCVRCGQVEPAE